MYVVDPASAATRIQSGETWSDFCDILKAAGQVLLREGTPEDAFTRAEGHRYLSRLVRAGLEAFVEHADPAAPTLRRVVHETVKLGADNPDSYYLNAEIDGSTHYVIRGRRNGVPFLEFAAQIGSYGEGAGLPPSGHLSGDALAEEADGSFLVHVGPERRGPNWLRTVPETRTIIVRQNRLDPRVDQLADLVLERAEGSAVPAAITPQSVDVGLMKAAMLVATAPRLFAEWAEGFAAHVNQLPRFDQATSDRMGGMPHVRYHHSAWRLAPHEGLVVRIPPWVCGHWNLQINNHWMESLDYRHHRIHTNSVLAASAADGSAVVVIGTLAKGRENGLDVEGHTHGTMCFRWFSPEPFDAPDPACEVVDLRTWAVP